MSEQSFEIRKSLVQGAKTLFSFVAMAGGFALIFLFVPAEDGTPWSLADRMVPFVIAASTLLVFAWGVIWLRRKALRSVSVDGEGIWMTQAGRASGLVRWEAIRGVRHRPLLRRMDLLDDDGRVLVRVSRYLYERGLLEEIIAERAHRMRAWDRVGSPYGQGTGPLGAQRVYRSRPWRYIGFSLRFVGLIALAVVAWVLVSEWLAVAIYLLGEIWSVTRNRTVTRLKITPERLVIDMFYQQLKLRRADIESIAVAEIWDGIILPIPDGMLSLEFIGYSGEAVIINRTDGSRRIELYGMGVPPEDMARRLNAWLADSADSTAPESLAVSTTG